MLMAINIFACKPACKTRHHKERSVTIKTTHVSGETLHTKNVSLRKPDTWSFVFAWCVWHDYLNTRFFRAVVTMRMHSRWSIELKKSILYIVDGLLHYWFTSLLVYFVIGLLHYWFFHYWFTSFLVYFINGFPSSIDQPPATQVLIFTRSHTIT